VQGIVAVFQKACGGEVLAADDELSVVGEQCFLVDVHRLGICKQDIQLGGD
jgi:hypothetical protein